jgi:hypothetical protein
MPQSAAVIVGCDRVWQDEEVRSRFGKREKCDRLLEDEGGVRSLFGKREDCDFVLMGGVRSRFGG